MKKWCFFLAVFTVLFQMEVFSSPAFWHVNVQSGLSDSFVKDILRDQYGYMWFATTNGLDRYDGYQFRKYTTIPLGNYNDDIESVCEDATNTIWVTSSNGIYVYDCIRDQLCKDVTRRLSQLGMTDSVTWINTDDRQNLWALSKHKVYYYDFKDKRLTVIDNPSGTPIRQITSLGNEAYVLAEDGEFYSVDLHARRLRYEGAAHMSDSYWRMIYLDTQGRLWFYTKHYPVNNLQCYSIKGKRWMTPDALAPLSKMMLTSLTDDGKGNIWIGTENEGIYIYSSSGATESIRQLTNNLEENNLLPSNHISSLYKDDRNTMWIGTSKRGVAYMDLSTPMFSVTKFKGKEDVSCIVEDKGGNLWIGFDGSGILKIDAANRETSFTQQNGSLPTNIITCSQVDQSGGLWIGTFGNGVLYLDGQRFVPYPYSDTNQQQMFISCMTADSEGNLWVGSIFQGLTCYQKDGREKLFTRENSDLNTNSLTCLHSDHDGHLYIGSSTGLYILDTRSRTFLKWAGDLNPLEDVFITSLYKDCRGLIWIGTRTGLKVYDERHNTFYQILQKDGLSNPYVRTLIEDNSKNVWASTDNGLTCIQTKRLDNGGYSFVCTPFFEEDGLQNSAFNSNVACLTRMGCLIGSTNGYLCIHENRYASPYSSVNIVFTSLWLRGQRVLVGDDTGILNCNLQQTDGIVLDYDQNSFSVTVSAMDYTKKHKIHYLYRLRGSQEKWVELDGNRINFNVLAPGSYTLEVKASDLGGWTSDVSTLKIRVRPPLWLSTPALILYFFIAVAGIFLYLKRMKRKHRETLAVQKLEMELEQQHQIEENKMRFFTNVSHDLKTPLSLIITPLEKVLSGNLEKDFRTELEMVWRNARLLMDEVTQLLDFRKIDVGSEKLQLSHGDFVEFLRKIVDNFRSYSQGRGIQLDLRINADSLEMNFDQNKMRRVVTNLLSNAFKYNKENGSVSVTVGRLTQAGQTLMRLEIADTGIGIKDENKPQIFDRFYQEEGHTEYVGSGIGLHIVKEYVTMHQGEVHVEDNHPQGSVFVVTIPMDLSASHIAMPEVSQPVERKESTPLETEENNSDVTILIVEDNHDFRMFLERCLNDQYRILTASNGIEALKVLDEEEVDIVISDIMMPEMNGLEFCNRIKTDVAYSHIPVILLTAKSTEANIITGLKDGADDYITKPFNLNILKLRVKKIIEWTQNCHRNFAKGIEIAPSEITVSSIDEELIKKAIRIVEENMSDSEFSVEDFGAAIGMTRGHLYKKLMAITGKSPIEFIRILRVKRGHSLLEQGRTNISEVAYTIGFSPKQFSKYFKEEYGCLPSVYLNNSCAKR